MERSLREAEKGEEMEIGWTPREAIFHQEIAATCVKALNDTIEEARKKEKRPEGAACIITDGPTLFFFEINGQGRITKWHHFGYSDPEKMQRDLDRLKEASIAAFGAEGSHLKVLDHRNSDGTSIRMDLNE